MFAALWNLIFFIIAIGILVTIHEAGHFFAARRCGVKVYRFSLGFGPVIWRRRGKDGVEYALSLIPLGGYVKMKGEPGDLGQSDEKGNGMRAPTHKITKDKGVKAKADANAAAGASADADAGAGAGADAGTGADAGADAGTGAGAGVGAGAQADANAKDDADGSSYDKSKVIETDFAEFRVGSEQPYDNKAQNNLPPLLAAAAIAAYENDEEASSKDEASDSFAEKTLWQRAFIVAAGPLSNLVLGYILFVLINVMGVESFRPVVADVIPDTAAAAAGFEPNDLIIKADGNDVQDWGDFSNFALINLGDKMTVDVKGDKGEGVARHLVVDLKDIHILPKSNLLELIGFYPMFGKVSDGFTQVVKDSPADRAGIKAGDTVLSINGEKVSSWYGLLRLTKKYGKNPPLDVEVRSQSGEIFHTKLTPEHVVVNGKPTERLMFGFVATTEYDPSLVFLKQYTIVGAIGAAWDDTVNVSLLIVHSIKKLISGAISAQNINGPISIAQGAGQSAQFGLTSFLTFLALLSINLGIVNLIPLPVLDGGQLMYIAYEGVTKRPPNEKIQTALSLVGLGLLLFLTFFSIFNDLTNL